MKNIKFLGLSLVTYLFWYFLIAFIAYDISWIDYLEETSKVNRLWFAFGLVVKSVFDVILWKYIKNKDRDEKDQKTYIYED